MNKKVAILINSCDLYEDVWNPFFSLFKTQWPDCPYDIYLNTENKTYVCDFLDVKTITTGNEKPWTMRIKKALDEIESDYILFTLEDFFLLNRVDETKFSDIISEMQNKREVGFVFFTPLGVKYDIDYKPDTLFSDVSKYADYRVNACLGLWKKEFLLQMLYLDGSPWEFEHNATRLSWLSKHRCCVINPDYSSIFSYSILPSEGYGITQRKWLPKNKELFDKYNIQVNFSTLGFIEKKSDSLNKTKQSEKAKIKTSQKHFSTFRRKIQKHKKRIKKQIRYFNDLLFLKPKFIAYCNDISKSGPPAKPEA